MSEAPEPVVDDEPVHRPPAIEFLGRLKVRYMVAGSAALRQYGFCLPVTDIDIWLDPSVGHFDWYRAVEEAADCEYFDYSRNVAAEFLKHVKVETAPKIDVLGVLTDVGVGSGDFEQLYRNSLISPLGRLLPLKSIIHNKRRINDGKHAQHLLQILRELT